MNTERITFGYLAFYNGKQFELFASSIAEAKDLAIAWFKPPKSKQHMVHVYLAEKEIA